MNIYWGITVFLVCAVALTGSPAQFFTAVLVMWATFWVTDTLEQRK